ncbi:MAG: hypothetical protein R2695_05100 [Acidimicrobiales bacterium]
MIAAIALLTSACEAAFEDAATGIDGTGSAERTKPRGQKSGGQDDSTDPVGDVDLLPTAAITPVTPDMIGTSVGVGVIAPAPSKAVGDRTISTDGTVLENVVVGCLTITADNVTVRNVSVKCDTSYPIKTDGADRTTVEYSRIDCGGFATKGIYFLDSGGFTVDSTEITGCEDQLYIDGGEGTRRIVDSVFHHQSPATGAGSDGIQLGAFRTTRGNVVVEGNWWEYDTVGCCANSVVALVDHAQVDLTVKGNYLDGDAGYWLVRCNAGSLCETSGNLVGQRPASGVMLADGPGSTAQCNWLTDGSLLAAAAYSGVSVDNSACPSGTATGPTVSTTAPTTTTTAKPATTTTAKPATTTTAKPATTTTAAPATTTTAPPPPPPAGSYVTPNAVGSTVGATATSTTVNGNLTLSTAGQTIADTTVNGCIDINADRVTLRNVKINCADGYPIHDLGRNNTRVERVTIDCMNNPSKGMYFQNASNFTVDRVHITRCDDQFFIDGGLGNSTIANSVFHNQAPASGAHTDGMQIGTFLTTTGTLNVTGNWWEYNRSGCCANGVLFLSGEAALTVNMSSNYFDADFGTHILRCRPQSTCNIARNTLSGAPYGAFIYADAPSGTSKCNRYSNGAFIPTNLQYGISVDNSNC